MNFRMAKRREGIVSLTHTEIMLVLMTIIILLLLAKSFALSKTKQELERANQTIKALAGSDNESAPGRQEPVDLEAEINEILVQNGVSVDDGSRQSLVKAVRQQVDENKQRGEREAAIAAALEQAGVGSKQDGTAETRFPAIEEQVGELARKAAVGEAVREAFGEEQMDPEKAKDRIANLQANDLKGKIGCVPCWTRPGKRQYYFAYDITYDAAKDSFRVQPHKDWDSGAPVVDAALDGEMSFLKRYPRRRVTRNKLLAFGQQVQERRKRAYSEDCHLMVSINEDADGKIVKFVRHQVGFCPIFR